MMEREHPPTLKEYEPLLPANDHWRWRNTRDLGFGFRLWPLRWTDFGIEGGGDRFGAQWSLNLGPLELIICANVGNHHG